MYHYEIVKVECLRYKLVVLTPSVYQPVNQIYWFENDYVQFRLENNLVTLVTKRETNSITEAKEIAEEYITSMETLWFINLGGKHFELEYIHADLVVRYRLTGEIRRKRRLETTISANVVDPKPKETLLFSAEDFRLLTSHNAVLLASRYKQYLEGKESVSSMGYYCYTAVNQMINNNHGPKTYSISPKVLKTLSMLTSIYGDKGSARKFSSERPHRSSEVEWIKCAIQKLMERVAKVDSGASSQLNEIRLTDLPKLDD